MRTYYSIEIILKDKTEKFTNIIDYEVIQGALFYIKMNSIITEQKSKKELGSIDTKMVWFPIKDIIKIEAKEIREFTSKDERYKYIEKGTI